MTSHGSMKVGVFIGGQHPPGADMTRRIAEHIEQAAAIREAGFDSIWLGQHLLTHPEQFVQTTPLLARLSAEAGDMALGTCLILLPLFNPVAIAEEYATLDYFTKGGVILGVGLGYRDVEYRAFGVDRKTRTRRFEEGVEVLKRLWSEDHVTFEGDHFRLEDVTIRPRPRQLPRPPIWIGCTADAAVERAARIGDAWLATNMSTMSEVIRQRGVYDRARESAGLAPPDDFARVLEVCVAPTRQKALNACAPYLEGKYRAYFSWGQAKILPGVSDPNISFDELMQDRFLIGSPDDCIRSCLTHREELGVTHLIIRLNFPGMPQESILQSIDLFGREVLPALR